MAKFKVITYGTGFYLSAEDNDATQPEGEYPRSEDQLREELRRHGVQPDAVGKVLRDLREKGEAFFEVQP